MLEQIKALSQTLANQTIANRRHLHAHPELSFDEYNTQQYVQNQLAAIGIESQKIANTGLIALIEGQNPNSKTVALRADMDALPITETNNIPYASTHPGIMHACGHDVHTASLLSTAHILHSQRQQFSGSIKLLFQPAEEKAPGGASIMIQQGALQNPAPSHILGQHVAPNIPVGKVGFREGMYMASTDELYLTITGRGGHGAMPDACTDPILIASHIIVALQQIISRNCDPKSPSVLSFGRIEGLGATNVIPDTVTIEGTFRCMDETWRATGLQKITDMATGMAQAMGASCHVNIVKGYPYLQNEPQLTRRSKQAAIAYLGADNVVDLDLWMAGEDFAFYTHHTNACFYRLGTRNEAAGITSGVHTPTFNIDEQALHIGPGLMAWLAIQELKHS
jgi:amidohydrolase